MSDRRTLPRLIFAALTIAGGAVNASDEALIARQAAYARAVDLLHKGGDHQQALAMLEIVARRGDARAQVVLGATYFNGDEVPADRPLGFAWLQVAATAQRSYFQVGAREKATAMMRQAEPTMTGAELIKADQLAAAFIAESERRIAEGLNLALKVFTPETATQVVPVVIFQSGTAVLTPPTASSDEPLFRVGCATGQRTRCPRGSPLGTPPHCTGMIVQPDAPPSAAPGPDTSILQPEYPSELRRLRLEGQVTLLAHVDRSGWICGVAVAVSSGVPDLDREAVDAASRWKVKPARKGAEPVEALYHFSIQFGLPDYYMR